MRSQYARRCWCWYPSAKNGSSCSCSERHCPKLLLRALLHGDVLDNGGVESSWCIPTRGGSLAVEMMGSGGGHVGIMS